MQRRGSRAAREETKRITMKGMNTSETEWMGETERATGVKRVEMRFQY